MRDADFPPTEITPSFSAYTLEDHADSFEDDVGDLTEKIAKTSAAHVSLAEVIHKVNHSGQKLRWPGPLMPIRLLPTSDSVGFHWNDEDDQDEAWIPQGITASWDADPDGEVEGFRIIAVSWYDHQGVDGRKRGSRVTFVNYEDPGKPEYRHVLLVKADSKGSFNGFRPVGSHAGGIAWVGHTLYVADTRAIRVFDLDTIWRTEPDGSREHKKIGMYDGKAYAAGYRYVIPQTGYYERPSEVGPDPLAISCVSLDRTTSPDSLITAEYKPDRRGVQAEPADARIVRWNLGRGGELASSDGKVRSSEAYVTSRANVNGALTHGDDFVLTTSEFERRAAWIHRAEVGTSRQYTGIPQGGPEDLTYQPQGKRAWTLTEYDGWRAVFGIPMSSIGGK
ncbi:MULTISPECIES: hypothetical protein [unclassified Streptomyces]|uniref:hypothetical protein n=1 Tax=unclassified Streptomyces TaxID=2593676 RepID=UPI000DD9FF88|nr:MULTISPECIES: hypothetical protein [unclassified Streptomyces]QZZ32213.1 hypothetical protein A7X85_43755 [Streptomyces sp. ST1015]